MIVIATNETQDQELMGSQLREDQEHFPIDNIEITDAPVLTNLPIEASTESQGLNESDAEINEKDQSANKNGKTTTSSEASAKSESVKIFFNSTRTILFISYVFYMSKTKNNFSYPEFVTTSSS